MSNSLASGVEKTLAITISEIMLTSISTRSLDTNKKLSFGIPCNKRSAQVLAKNSY